MAYKKTPLTEQQYLQLGLPAGWQASELSADQLAGIPGLQRRGETIAAFGSADISDPRLLNRINSIAGIDHLVYESRPSDGEPAGNAYHYVIQKTANVRVPYILHGPFRSETRVGHWFEADDLDMYDEVKSAVAAAAPKEPRRR